MLGWAAFIVAASIVAAVPFFLGSLVVLPALGHATWRLYRRVVEPAEPIASARGVAPRTGTRSSRMGRHRADP